MILKTADRTVSACWASSVQCRDLGKADTNANIYALPGALSLWARKHHAMPYIYIYIYKQKKHALALLGFLISIYSDSLLPSVYIYIYIYI